MSSSWVAASRAVVAGTAKPASAACVGAAMAIHRRFHRRLRRLIPAQNNADDYRLRVLVRTCYGAHDTWKYRTEILPVQYRRNPSCNARYCELLPKSDVFVLRNKRCAALNPCGLVTWKYRAEMLPVQYRSDSSCKAIYCELLAKSGFLCCSYSYYEYGLASSLPDKYE